jgi:hypothetical protein
VPYLIFHRNRSHTLAAPIVDRYCCVRCAPRPAEFCCDLCHPDHFKLPADLGPYKKTTRRVNQHKPKPFTMNASEQNLRAALIKMRHELADTYLPKGSFLTPQSLMPTMLLDRIVGLAHDQKIPTIEALRDQITWAFLSTHDSVIMQLVNHHLPPPLASPFTTAPLAPRSAALANVSASSASVKQNTGRQNRCGGCGEMGHNST